MDSNLKVCFVIGPPGSGKGTLCSKLALDVGAYHLSTGDYLRELSNDAMTLERTIMMSKADFDRHLHDRRLLPPDFIVAVLRHKVETEQAKGQSFFIIDGFPRSIDSAVEFEKQVTKPSFVFFFQCPDDIARDRFLRRARDDDDSKIFEKRFEEFQRNNQPIVNHYRCKQISTAGNLEDTYGRVLNDFKTLMMQQGGVV